MSTRGFSIPLDVGASIAGMIGKTGNNTAGEDSPSAPTPARIVDIRNVMPTELGYFSAYGPIKVNTDHRYELQPHEFKYTEFEEDGLNRPLAALKKARIQHVIPYETASGVRVYIILAETGIFVRNNMAALGEEIEEPEKVVGPADVVEVLIPDEGIFNLWTYAFLDGSLYCYLQNREEVYIFGDLGIHLSLDTLEVEYRKIREWESDILQVVAAKPSFLNMEGQIGIFRAGNRLGFWDSDNAIAWSSAFNKMDFTPDVVSLAGVTKFTAMTGGIVAIISTTRGFIIYCSSCVLVASHTGSEEQWSADVVLAETGIDYYFQATSGSNPEQHFAWTKSGLYRILNGRAEAILEDDFRALKAQNGYDNEMLYRLTAIDDTYLVISRAPIWHERPAKSDFVIGNIKGEKGDYPFYIPSVKVPTPELGVGWQDVLEGRYPGLENPNLDDDWILEDPDMPSLDEGKPLIPFFTGYAYYPPPIAGQPIKATPKESTAVPVPVLCSSVFPGVTLERDDILYIGEGCVSAPNDKTVTHLISNELSFLPVTWSARQEYYDLDKPNRFFDKAGDEFVELIQGAVTRFNQDTNDLWEMLTWVGPTSYNGGCLTFKGSVEDNHFNGWRIQGITLEMAAPEDWKYPELTPGDRPEITSNGFMTPEAYNYYKYFLSEIELPDSTQLRFNFGQVTERPIPFRPIPPKWVVDSCSVGLFTFVDNVVAVEILWGNVVPLEEALRPATWTCTQHQALANCTIESIEDRWVRYRCEGPDGSIYYDVRKEHEVCLSEACALNDPIPRAAIEMSDNPGDDCSYDAKREDADGVIVWYRRNFRIERHRVFLPVSFIGKTLEEINHMLDISNRRLYPDLWQPIVEAENSGYGYADPVSSSWTRYIKTISRARLWMQNEDGECTPPLPPLSLPDIPPNFEFEEVILDQNEGGEFDDYLWPWGKYPENLNENSGYPDPPEWTWPIDKSYGATYRKGTRMPYYPIYDKAWVLDLPLAKWGSMDWPHSLVFSTHPAGGMGASIIPSEDYSTGRPSPIKQFDTRGTVDSIMPFGIVPKFVVPRQAYWEDPYSWYAVKEELYDNPRVTYPSEILMQHGLPTLLNRGGTGGRLTVEATSLTRDGFTKMVGLSGDGVTHATIQVLASFHGGAFGTVMPLAITTNYPMYLSNQQSYVGTFNLEPAGLGSKMYQDFRAPFVLVGKEFQITVAGHFALQKLICYGQPTGGVRFFPTEYTGW